MDRWQQYYPWHAMGMWCAIFLILLLINTWMRKDLRPPVGSQLSDTAPRSGSTISAASLDPLADDHRRPDVLVTTIQQLVFLLACHGVLGGFIAGIGADQLPADHDVELSRVLYWTFNFEPPLRAIPAAIGLGWLLTVAYAGYRGRSGLLRALTYTHRRLRRLFAVAAFIPIAVLMIVIFSSGGHLPADLHPLVAACLTAPGVFVMVAWWVGRHYRRAFRRYANLPVDSTSFGGQVAESLIDLADG